MAPMTLDACSTVGRRVSLCSLWALKKMKRMELEARLRAHLSRHDGKSNLLFVNQCGRPVSANKLREKQLHPLLDKLGIERGGFHSLRHGAASSLLADGATPAVVQRQLRHSDARITLGIYGHVIGDDQRTAVQHRSTRLVN